MGKKKWNRNRKGNLKSTHKEGDKGREKEKEREKARMQRRKRNRRNETEADPFSVKIIAGRRHHR